MNDQIQLPANTMFARTPVYQVSAGLVFGLRQPVVTPDPSDRILEVTQELVGRLDTIALQLYGSEELWWVIADLNFMVDPMTEVSLGKKLRLPTPTRVQELLAL